MDSTATWRHFEGVVGRPFAGLGSNNHALEGPRSHWRFKNRLGSELAFIVICIRPRIKNSPETLPGLGAVMCWQFDTPLRPATERKR